jgi:hypothetical protein
VLETNDWRVARRVTWDIGWSTHGLTCHGSNTRHSIGLTRDTILHMILNWIQLLLWVSKLCTRFQFEKVSLVHISWCRSRVQNPSFLSLKTYFKLFFAISRKYSFWKQKESWFYLLQCSGFSKTNQILSHFF